jgi:CRISPR-associated endonuclease/helicase Cas3
MSEFSGIHIWAKTDMQDQSSHLWLSLRQHLLDTMGISHHVFNDYLSPHTRNMIDEAFLGHGEQVMAFLAGVHDVGKCTPAFEKQIMDSEYGFLIDNLSRHGFDIPKGIIKSSYLRHETSGFFALRKWLMAHGFIKGCADSLAIIVGGHHGKYHEADVYNAVGRKLPKYFGSGAWDDERNAIIADIARLSGFDGIMHELESMDALPMPLQSMITGCVVMSDWIASSTWMFPLLPHGTYNGDQRMRTEKGWSRAGLGSAWSVSPPEDTDDMLHDEFDIPSSASPNAMQEAAVSMASRSHGPSMMIIESPMGSGKTEAALMCAHQLAYRNGHGGMAFSLPTQATANGILPRVMKWIPRTTGGRESLELIHGRAALNEDFANLRGANIYDDSTLVVNRWFDGSRRGVLANFVVCTIDQVLMLALKSKHFDLRHLGLANKVVIVDEVHAADDYMMVYLDRALEWLAALGSSVILLSATLPSQRRREMVRSFSNGLRLIDDGEEAIAPDAYPLITCVSSVGTEFSTPHIVQDTVEVRLGHLADDEDVLSCLRSSLCDGGCACVIKNTVNGAQSMYETIRGSGIVNDDEIMIVHSRFNGHDRSMWERSLLRMFGKNKDNRPHRFIVVGTQVLEQSLDIDFDVMITDIAPMDLLLQRSGRLHRHRGTDAIRPRRLSIPQLFITGYAENHDGITFDNGSLYVYGFGQHKNTSKLLRTVALLKDRATVSIPDSIHPLVESAYDTDIIPPCDFADDIRTADEELKSIVAKKEQDASHGVLIRPFGYDYHNVKRKRADILWGSNDMDYGGSSEESIMASVRDIQSSLGVIMVISEDDDSMRFASPDMDERNGMISLLTVPDAQLSKDILSQSIQLPSSLAGPWIIDSTIRILEDGMIASWQQSPLLKGELVMKLDTSRNTVICYKHKDYEVSYSNITGLCIKERND